jgi:choline kinase
MNSFNRFTTSTRNTSNKNTFIILSAGAGRRMACYGPKSILRHADKTIIQHQTEIIRHYDPKADIILVVGFQSFKIIDKVSDIRIIENINYDQNTQIESMRLAVNASIISNLFVIHGDIIFSKAMIDFGVEYNRILVDKCGRIGESEIGVVIDDDVIVNMAYGLDTKWGQIFYLRSEHFSMFRTLLNNGTYQQNTTHEMLLVLMNKGVVFHNHECSHPNSTLKEIKSIKDIQ